MSDTDKKINITASEWKIMQVLWKDPYLTLAEIKNRLDSIIVWDRTTINTLIRRLRKKNIVGVEEARYCKYYPLVSESVCLKIEMSSILQKFFYRSPKKLMMTLVEQEDFTKEDIEEIENLLATIKDKYENA